MFQGLSGKLKDYPLYNIKLAISKDGFKWVQTKKVCINLRKMKELLHVPLLYSKIKSLECGIVKRRK